MPSFSYGRRQTYIYACAVKLCDSLKVNKTLLKSMGYVTEITIYFIIIIIIIIIIDITLFSVVLYDTVSC
jgi:hypothetical protein